MTPDELRDFQCKELEVARALVWASKNNLSLSASGIVSYILTARDRGETTPGINRSLSAWIVDWTLKGYAKFTPAWN